MLSKIYNKEPTVSLYQKNINWILLSKLLKQSLLVITIIACYNVLFSFSFFNLLKSFIWASFWKLAEKLENWCQSHFKYRQLLYYFLESNKLYTETNLDGKHYISTSAIMGWKETDNKVIIKAYKQGDTYSKRLENLEIELQALLNLPLESKIVRPAIVEYHFYTSQPSRLQANQLQRTLSTGLPIDLGYGIVYNPIDCPHILLAGGTGSGKSIFISYLILEFLKRKSILYICDPKNSDLGSLSHYLGEDKVATSPNHIARIVRLTVEEMNRRYEYMRENFRYGSNFSDHGFKMTWLVFDEMGAFQASGTDKKSKEVINEVMDGIKQIILLGRQAGVFILIAAQQVNADTLNTDLRDNLGLRIALGSNSSEGYRMVFGSATPPVKQPIEVKGAGYLYMQGSGKESAEYWESPYLNPKEFDFINELQKLIN
ncbi:FtsK/SpoIIIE domain-containing protein [Streptococcus caprae]|uniref:FtsK/SpoIIIE domain-containing protein n=1 Tax=Streptococcus caprae TaxID=1640501 RepID=A0ABV8CTX3_9STRE